MPSIKRKSTYADKKTAKDMLAGTPRLDVMEPPPAPTTTPDVATPEHRPKFMTAQEIATMASELGANATKINEEINALYELVVLAEDQMIATAELVSQIRHRLAYDY